MMGEENVAKPGKIERKSHAGYIKCEYDIRTPVVSVHSQGTFREEIPNHLHSVINIQS